MSGAIAAVVFALQMKFTLISVTVFIFFYFVPHLSKCQKSISHHFLVQTELISGNPALLSCRYIFSMSEKLKWQQWNRKFKMDSCNSLAVKKWINGTINSISLHWNINTQTPYLMRPKRMGNIHKFLWIFFFLLFLWDSESNTIKIGFLFSPLYISASGSDFALWPYQKPSNSYTGSCFNFYFIVLELRNFISAHKIETEEIFRYETIYAVKLICVESQKILGFFCIIFFYFLWFLC